MFTDITAIDLKILSAFTIDYSAYYSIRELTKKLNINYSNAFKRVNNLVKKSILTKSKIGQASIIKLNLKNISTIKIISFVEEIKSIKLNNASIYSIIKEAINIDPFCCIGLFGSRVSKKATKNSDWDVFVITTKIKEMNKIITKLSYIKDIQLQVFSLEEFEESLLSIEETVVKHIVKNKQILYNPHPFYSIISKWEMIKYAPTQ